MIDPTSRRVGLIAGRGLFPSILVDSLAADGLQIVVARLAGQASRIGHASVVREQSFPIGSMGVIARFFLDEGAPLAYMAGGVSRRGAWANARPDIHAIRLVVSSFFGGDDRLLRGAARVFEKLGVTVGDPTSYVADLFAHQGHLAGPVPSSETLLGMRMAMRAALENGLRDNGQGALVFRGKLVGLETRSGTDALIAGSPGPGAILGKVVKPGQDRRFDMPAIGPSTILAARMVGLSGIAVEEGGVLLLNRTRIYEHCHRHGISLFGFRRQGE